VKSKDGDRSPAFDRFVARGLTREIDSSGNACPDADLLAAWFDHTLSALESERIESHVSGCECCQQILAALARSEPEVVRAAPLPSPAHAWHWHWRWAVPLATAVLVVVVGTKTLFSPGPVTVVGTPTTQAARVEKAAEPPMQPLVAPPPPAAQPKAAATAVREKLAPVMAARVAVPAIATGAPAAPAAAGAAADSMEFQRAAVETERARADKFAQKAVTPNLPAPPPPPPPPSLTGAAPKPAAPAVAEALSVEGRAARPAAGLLGMRQVSVTTPALAGSAVAWRFGQDGVIEKSSDRGQTWERQSSGVANALADASAPTDRVCWMVGARGIVLRTTDGRTWQRLNSPTDADLVAVHAWNESSATITASDRSEYETADGGKTWRRRQP
jgi:hypothetical protein